MAAAEEPLEPFATWQEQAAAEDIMRAQLPAGHPEALVSADRDTIREQVARAICQSDSFDWDDYLTGALDLHSDYRRNADAVMAEVVDPLLTRLARVEAVLADLDRFSDDEQFEWDRDGALQRLGARDAYDVAVSRLRMALSADPGRC